LENSDRIIHLAVIKGPDKGQMFFLKSGKEALVGRAPASDLRLTDPGASQRHCLIRAAGDMVFIEDLGSRNGTLVNGDPTTRRVLDENGTLEVGTSTIELTWVSTDKQVPIGSVPSAAAPTLLERNVLKTSEIPMKVGGGQTTVMEENDLKEFQSAREMLGKMIGDYLLLEPLGVNELGVVFRAKGIKTREHVALVLIKKVTARTAELLETFLSNTRTGLDVPNTVKLLGVGESGEHCYIASQVARGRDLESALSSGRRFDHAEAIKLLLPICHALQAAHVLKVIHGEVQPDNILLTADEKPLLLGLGLARKTDWEGRYIFERKKDSGLEKQAFMSPELTLAKELTPASDVYSTAATLYMLLTGKLPFKAATRLELVRKIRWEEPPLVSTLAPAVPQALSDVIIRAMTKEFEARHQSIIELSEALHAAIAI
jgi:eukaryotic-like serine/threonine-protein kinase